MKFEFTYKELRKLIRKARFDAAAEAIEETGKLFSQDGDGPTNITLRNLTQRIADKTKLDIFADIEGQPQ